MEWCTEPRVPTLLLFSASSEPSILSDVALLVSCTNKVFPYTAISFSTLSDRTRLKSTSRKCSDMHLHWSPWSQPQTITVTATTTFLLCGLSITGPTSTAVKHAQYDPISSVITSRQVHLSVVASATDFVVYARETVGIDVNAGRCSSNVGLMFAFCRVSSPS